LWKGWEYEELDVNHSSRRRGQLPPILIALQVDLHSIVGFGMNRSSHGSMQLLGHRHRDELPSLAACFAAFSALPCVIDPSAPPATSAVQPAPAPTPRPPHSTCAWSHAVQARLRLRADTTDWYARLQRAGEARRSRLPLSLHFSHCTFRPSKTRWLVAGGCCWSCARVLLALRQVYCYWPHDGSILQVRKRTTHSLAESRYQADSAGR
jgi:hypothetical protein